MTPDVQSPHPWPFDDADIVNVYPVQLAHDPQGD